MFVMGSPPESMSMRKEKKQNPRLIVSILNQKLKDILQKFPEKQEATKHTLIPVLGRGNEMLTYSDQRIYLNYCTLILSNFLFDTVFED